jgi:hypothetical protein
MMSGDKPTEPWWAHLETHGSGRLTASWRAIPSEATLRSISLETMLKPK